VLSSIVTGVRRGEPGTLRAVHGRGVESSLGGGPFPELYRRRPDRRHPAKTVRRRPWPPILCATADRAPLGRTSRSRDDLGVAGAGVKGGRYYGRWPGLSDGDDADLLVTTDYRSVLAEIVSSRFRASTAAVFPQFRPESLGLMTSR